MLFREELSVILHDVQANGKGALSLATPTLVDPRLEAISVSRSSSVIRTVKTPYNKSRKRAIAEVDNKPEDGTLVAKKVDLGTAIQGMAKEIEKSRKAKELYESF